MLSKIRFFVAFALLIISVGSKADEGKSFSRQMNEIKRSGDYIYTEASAPEGPEAKAACDELLKIEITKYLASADQKSQADSRIVKNLDDYDCRYIMETRGDMIRVFGFIPKSSISVTEPNKSNISSASAEEKMSESRKDNGQVRKEEKAAEEKKVSPPSPAVSSPVNVQSSSPVVSHDTAKGAVRLKSEGMQLAKWQIDMLESVINEPDMTQAKKLLNRYKYQNRIKRLGDKSVSNPRPADSYYLIFGNADTPVALLAPSSTTMHYDMLSGMTVQLDNYSVNQYFWFQISQ